MTAILLAGCAWSLEEPAPPAEESPAPLAEGCEVGSADGGTVLGVLRSRRGDDGELRWFADVVAGPGDGVERTDAMLTGSVDPTAARCDALQVAAGAAVPAFEGAFVSGLDVLPPTPDGDPAARYFSAWVFDADSDFGVATLGVGVATAPTLDGPWTTGPLLFGDGYPPYGAAAVRDGDTVFAYGCVSARFFDGDCYAARAPRRSLDDSTAYEFWNGSGRYTDRIDDAFPVSSGGADAGVRRVGDLWVMAYAPPLGATIVMRRAPSPAGPWSAQRTVARCALPEGGEALCSSVQLHPDVPAPAGQVAVSYAVHSRFGPPDLATRVAFVELP